MATKFSWKMLSLAMVTAAAVAAAACGGGDGEPTQPPATPTRAAASATATPAPQATAPPAPAASAILRGGTIQIPIPGELATPDPSKTANYTTYFSVAANVYSQIIKTKERTYTDLDLEGDLATAWSVSSDGKAVTFNISPQARWQNIAPVNGRPVTSADIKWTWELIKDPAYASAHRDRWPAVIQGMDTPDDKTLVMRLSKPFAPFMLSFIDPRSSILPREVYEQHKNFSDKVVGSGAFHFERYETGVKTVNVRNPNYWKVGDDGKALPYIDSIEVLVLIDPQATLANIQAGRLAFTTPGALSTDQLETLQKSNPNIAIRRVYNMDTTSVQINLAVKPWDDQRVRQAAMKAFDRTAMRRDITRQADSPLTGPFPEGIEQFSLSQEELGRRLAFDPQGAKALLREAGFATGFETELTTKFVGPTQDAILSFLAQSLNDVGIKAKVVIPPGGSAGGVQLQQQKKFQIMYATFGQEGNVWNLLRPNWYSNGSTNFFNINDPKLDAAIDEAEGTVDAAQQVKLVQDMARYILDKAYLLPLPHGWSYQHQQPWLKNFSRTWPYGHKGLEHAWIQK